MRKVCWCVLGGKGVDGDTFRQLICGKLRSWVTVTTRIISWCSCVPLVTAAVLSVRINMLLLFRRPHTQAATNSAVWAVTTDRVQGQVIGKSALLHFLVADAVNSFRGPQGGKRMASFYWLLILIRMFSAISNTFLRIYFCGYSVKELFSSHLCTHGYENGDIGLSTTVYPWDAWPISN